jgi:hypothetical protein
MYLKILKIEDFNMQYGHLYFTFIFNDTYKCMIGVYKNDDLVSFSDIEQIRTIRGEEQLFKLPISLDERENIIDYLAEKCPQTRLLIALL